MIPKAGRKYADDVKNLIQFGFVRPDRRLHRRIHPRRGRSRGLPRRLPPARSTRTCAQAGGLCITNEVQTGFGRTGTHYWGFETQGVIPDIVTMAKGIGNGRAPGGRRHHAPKITPDPDQAGSTSTPSAATPSACAQGRAVLQVIDKEKGCRPTAWKIGAQLKSGLGAPRSRSITLIGEVRGLGLMLGVELVKDRKTKEPAKEACAEVFKHCKDLGLLIGKGGLWGNTLRIKPPMCITAADADFMLGRPGRSPERPLVD